MTVIIVISLGIRIFNMVVTGEGRWFSQLLLLCSNSVRPVTALSPQAGFPCPSTVKRPKVARKQFLCTTPLSTPQTPHLEPLSQACSWAVPPLGGLCSAAPHPSWIPFLVLEYLGLPPRVNIYSICSINAVYKLWPYAKNCFRDMLCIRSETLAGRPSDKECAWAIWGEVSLFLRSSCREKKIIYIILWYFLFLGAWCSTCNSFL